jgi:hypothetical protein
MDHSDLYPALGGFPPAVADVARLPIDATDLRLLADSRGWHRLPEFTRLTRLWCFRVNDRRMTAIAACGSLERLYLDGVRSQVAGLDRLQNLVVVSLDSATRLLSLDEIPRLAALEALSVQNAPRVTTLAALRDGHRLKALNVSGGIWSRMNIESLDPLRRLTGLRYLDLLHLKVRDESLEPLEGLIDLKMLRLANFYPLREFARLSSRLTKTECSWFRPFVDLPNVQCGKCHTSSIVVLTGKGSSTLCRHCDAVRLERHEDRFRALAATAA